MKLKKKSLSIWEKFAAELLFIKNEGFYYNIDILF